MYWHPVGPTKLWNQCEVTLHKVDKFYPSCTRIQTKIEPELREIGLFDFLLT